MPEILLRHAQHITGVGQEDIPALYVLGHILVFPLLEVLQLGGVISFYPASFVQVDWLPTALGAILILQPVLDDLELQLAHGAHDTAPVELVDEKLGDALIHQLLQSFLELLALHGVVVLYILEHLGGERGQPAEMQLLSLRERISYLEDAVVGQSHDVARISLVDSALALRHELRGAGEAHRLAQPHVLVGLVAHELAAAHLAEGYARAVVWVYVGGNLEDEARELVLRRLHHALLRLGGTGAGGYAHEAVEQLLHAEVVEGGAEEDGGGLPRQVAIHGELGVNAVYQLQVIAQLGGLALPYPLVQLSGLYVYGHLLRHSLLVGGEEVELPLVDIVHALEAQPLADRPREGADMDVELLFQLVEQLEGVSSLAVHLVDEDDDGGVPHAAHLHELAGLRLHALGGVHHDDGGVHGGKRAVGVLGEVLVARGVQDIDFVSLVIKLHHGGGDRDAALLLDVHPVGGGRLPYLVALHGARHLYLPAEEQELLGERGLSSVGVGYDGECPSSLYLVHVVSLACRVYIYINNV